MEEDTTTLAMAAHRESLDLQDLRENPLWDHRALRGHLDLQAEATMANPDRQVHLDPLARPFLDPTEALRPSTFQARQARQGLRDCRVTHRG